MSQLPIESAIPRFKANEERIDFYVNGAGYTSSSGVFVPGLRDAFKEFNLLRPRGVWVAGTHYSFRDLYEFDGIVYLVMVDHTATTVAADLSAGKVIQWQGVTMQEVEALIVSGAESDQFGQIAAMLYDGQAVKCGGYGDSTMTGYNGYDLSTFVPVPSPLAFQNFVNDFNGNTALTVVNHGIGGTTASQMIAGTDGSGSTFEDKMKVSDETFVLCNHGINDNTLSNPAAYRAALIDFVRIARKYNKAPVLITPFACTAPGPLGQSRHTMRGPMFAEVMRSVAREYGVKLIDNFKYSDMMIKSGDFNPFNLLPDCIHGSPYFYEQMGRNFAECLFELTPITGPNQYVPMISGMIQATNLTALLADVTKCKAVFLSNANGAAMNPKMRMIVQVGESGLDLALARIIWPGSAKNTMVTVDGPALAQVTNIGGHVTGTWPGSSYPMDAEVIVASKLPPGMHIIVQSADVSGAIGNEKALTCSYLKSVKDALPSNQNVAFPGTSSQMNLPVASLLAVSNGGTVMYEKIRTDRTGNTLNVSFRAKLNNQTGVFICGSRQGNTSTPAANVIACRSILLYLDSINLKFGEVTSETNFDVTDFGPVPNISTAPHDFIISITPSGSGDFGYGTANIYVDGGFVGTRHMKMPYLGGYLGLWSNGLGALEVSNVSIGKLAS